MRSSSTVKNRFVFPVEKFMKRKILSQKVDVETGEILETEEKVSFAQRDYISFYLNDMKCVEIFKGVDLAFVYVLCNMCTFIGQGNRFGGNVIDMNGSARKEIANILGVKPRRVGELLKYVTDRHILKRVEKGYYQLNPMFFAKGKVNDATRLADSGGYGNSGGWTDPTESIKPEGGYGRTVYAEKTTKRYGEHR